MVHPLAPPFCTVCGDPVLTLLDTGCARCRERPSLVAMSRAVGEYRDALRSIVHALKYDKHQSLAAPLAKLMAIHGGEVIAGADAAVPVPLHWLRHWKRGFNQAQLLARHLGLPVWPALRRIRATKPQVSLEADARRSNVRGAFRLARRWPVCKGWTDRVEGRVLVVVDDVLTTGSTVETCAAVLLDAGAREVRALTAARVVGLPRR